jgi:hypothetical protein
MAYYHLNQYELANTALSEYLKNSTSPKHFWRSHWNEICHCRILSRGGENAAIRFP